MSNSNLAAIAAFACLLGFGLHFSTIPEAPARGGDPFSAIQNSPFHPRVGNQLAAAKAVKTATASKEAKKTVDPKSLSRGGKMVFDSCRGRLSRRGVSAGSGTKAAKFCVCAAQIVVDEVPYSKNSFKYAGALVDAMLDRHRKGKNATKELKKSARSIIKRVDGYQRRDIYKTVRHAFKSCRLHRRLGLKYRSIVVSALR